MGVREKLVELLDDMQRSGTGYFGSAIENKKIADYLIAQGVTVQENVEISDELLNQLKNAPITICKEEPSIELVQEWISVDDRLPEEGEYVLCVLKGFHYGGKIQVCKFVPADKFKDKPYFENFRNGFPSVTHWMPLPQPPKGE